ncbi:MAG: cytochrome c [Gammaproteobacteria bacterium]|nr:cytochrome c [Gammaproteobacteria bacterium]MDH5171815.1 cytochrome c [Gammaproteobacteria bacterium]
MNSIKTHRGVFFSVLVLGVCMVGLFFLLREDVHAPAALDTYQATPEKGRYLALVGNCTSCHTREGGKPYAGGVEFQTPFGILYSTNITMDRETGIGGWSFEDFFDAMKHGVRPDGTHLYPAFPYTDFARLTDEDIASLFLFVQTIAPEAVPARPNELAFPYSVRPLLVVWKVLFHDLDSYSPDMTRSDSWNRGAYLVEGLGHCGACHTPRNFLGAEKEDLALTGGVYLDKVKTGKFREWSGVNLTPAPTGLAKWNEDDIVAYLKNGQSRHAVVNGPMNDVVMNSTRFLTDADAAAMAAYLKGIPANEQRGSGAPDPETLRAGEIGYTVHCGSCHLPTGLGDDILGVSLAGSAIVQAENPASLLNVILYGPHLPAPPFVVDRTQMKMFGKKLSDQDIASIASYVRSSFGNRGGAVSPEQVGRQR